MILIIDNNLSNFLILIITWSALSVHAEAYRGHFHEHFYVQIFHMNVVSAAFSSYMYVAKAAETTFARNIRTFKR